MLRREYKDILLFCVALLAADFVWKLCVEETSFGTVTCLGADVTDIFSFFTHRLSQTVYALIHSWNPNAMLSGTKISFTSGNCTTIVWSCTAIKQAFIFLVIMLVARGKWYHKLWYIPAGWVCIHLFNIVRILLIAIAVEHHPEWFHILHTYILKYVFYGMIFLLWWLWLTICSISPQAQTKDLEQA